MNAIPNEAFKIKQNDTSPGIEYTFFPLTDLTGATVQFHMFKGGSQKVNAAATIHDAAAGIVRYAWLAADTDTAGAYDAEFQVTYADGRIETFPNEGNIKIHIDHDLA